MAKGKTLITSKVLHSREFANMSHEAQLLYINLLLEADSYGVVQDCERVRRGFGFDQKALTELKAHRFAIDFRSNGEELSAIRHWWVMNTFRYKGLSNQNGVSDFIEELKSALCSVDGGQTYELQSDIPADMELVTPTPEEYQAKGKFIPPLPDARRVSGTESNLSQSQLNVDSPIQYNAIQSNTTQCNGNAKSNGNASPAVAACPHCRRDALKSIEPNGGTLIECMHCHSATLIDSNGEMTTEAI